MLSAPRPRGESGIVGFNLAVTIAFALYAVIALTRVTIAAQQIDDRVEVIFGEVGPIDQELDTVALLNPINDTAAAILNAARPLSGQADQILQTARSIDGTVSQILGNATDINASVRSINGTVNTLMPVVRSINDGVEAINRKADVALGAGHVGGIRSDLNIVLGIVGGGGTTGHGGPPGPDANGKTIHGHANSIECNTALTLVGSLLTGATCERAG
ncbi:MAG: hypothetical protein ACRD0F_08600 [Acidimicrobiales bacterium]